jgi:hypothetical protein
MRVAWVLLGPLLALAQVSPALANDFDDFQVALEAYQAQDYARAAVLFEDLAGGDVPRTTDRPLLVESRKYLAACQMFLGREADAEATFVRLLRDEPGYVIDPLTFPEDVVRLFARVRERMERERQEAAVAEARAREKERLEEVQRRVEQRARAERLMTLARTERVEEVHSRWVAMVPFGVGQFQNDDDGLGLVLAVTEGLLVATSITTFIVHENLRGQQPIPSEIDDAEFAAQALQLTNQISLGLFAALAITGIVDAQLRFKKSKSYDRPRKLPEDDNPSFELGVGPGSVTLRVHM